MKTFDRLIVVQYSPGNWIPQGERENGSSQLEFDLSGSLLLLYFKSV